MPPAEMNDLTLDDIVRTSDPQAVRTRFDARNLSRLRLLAWIALAASGPGLIAALVANSWMRAAIVASSAAATIIAVRTTRPRASGRLTRSIRQHVSAYVIGWCVLQSTFLVLISARTEALIAGATIFPLLMLGFRMLPAELLSLHGLLATVFITGVAIAPPVARDKNGTTAASLIISGAFMNGVALSIELLASRRWKREIIADWSARRLNAQEQVRMRDELRYAREVQLSMLPAAPPALDWVELAGISMPATEVGGDYYDYLTVGDGLAIVTGDVAGHGLASGIVLAALRGGFTLLRESLGDPASVLQRLHELVAQTSRRRMLVTCAVLLLDRERRRAIVASAGHPPLLVRRGESGTVARMELFAPPLGVRLPLRVESTDLSFSSGDVFVLHSDGVYETRNAAGDAYGLDRLESLLASSDSATPREICDAIARDLDTFRGGTPQEDDVTIVVARIT
jgi:serine phosphatase RsbU (regulator of sigma subunit)